MNKTQLHNITLVYFIGNYVTSHRENMNTGKTYEVYKRELRKDALEFADSILAVERKGQRPMIGGGEVK